MLQSGARSILEREGEVAALNAAVSDACDGAGTLLIVQGAAGLGKSRLLEVVAEQAGSEGVAVLRARGEELERTRPWALVRLLFTSVLAQRSTPGALSVAAEPAARLFGARDDSDPAPGFDDPLPLIHSLFWLTADLAAGRPLLLAIDDAHWGDEPSLRFVRYLLPRLADLPVAVVLARRPGERGSEQLELEAIAGDPRARTLQLAALSSVAMAELVRLELGPEVDPEIVRACAETTRGNPFYLRELLLELRAGVAEGASPSPASIRGAAPGSVTRTIFVRLSRLGSPAASLARAVAILGDRASFPHAAELAGLDLAAASAALDALAAAEILAPGEPLSFVHPLVAHAIHGDIAAGERGDLHARAARLLERDGALPEEVASQLLLAGRRADPWAVGALQTAARRAVSQGAFAAAADYLARALEEPPAAAWRGEVLGELGRAEAMLGRPQAGARFAAAVELAADPGERARLRLALGRVLAVRGDHAAAATAFAEGLQGLDDTDSELARELEAAWWMSARIDPTQEVTLAGRRRELDGTRSPTPAQRQLLAQLALQRAFETAPREELRALAERAWDGGALLAVDTSDGLACSLVTATLLLADEIEREIEICDAMLADARRRGSPMAFATVSYCRGYPLLQQGQVDRALADLQAAVDARQDGWSTFLGSAASCLALCHLERDSLDDARAALALVEDDPAIQASLQYLMVLAARGSLLMAEGAPDDALEHFLRFGELSAAGSIDFSGAFAWQSAAAIAASTGGHLERARELAREALAHARRQGGARMIAHAQRACGHAERGEPAIEHFEAAVHTLEGGPPRLQRAYALVDLGAALRRARRRADAREHLRTGLALASAGGAHALAQRARTELAAAGARTRPHTRTGVESLTPSEGRIATMAAAGHSNRAIAQSLFVTVKAVEYHLANAYRKLDISGRGQLAPLLVPSELD